jgi:predicted regulator of Ras-like GTPase activity (Roadblock/LC7/MglB family)
MSRTESLNKALSNLQASSADIEAAAVVSVDGLIIASSLPAGLEEAQNRRHERGDAGDGHAHRRRAQARRHRAALRQGDPDGYVIIMAAGPHAVLLAMTRKDAKLGLVFLDVSRCADDVKKALL